MGEAVGFVSINRGDGLVLSEATSFTPGGTALFLMGVASKTGPGWGGSQAGASASQRRTPGQGIWEMMFH